MRGALLTASTRPRSGGASDDSPPTASKPPAARRNPAMYLVAWSKRFGRRYSCDEIAIGAGVDATGPVMKARLRKEQTHDQVRFALEVIKITGIAQTSVVAQQVRDEVLLRHN